MEKIIDCRSIQRNSFEFVMKSRIIHDTLKQFSSNMNILTQNLTKASTEYHITQRELGQRQSLLDNLTIKKRQLEEAFDNCQRGQTLDRSPFSREKVSLYNQSHYEETDETRILSLDDIKQQQVIKVQDHGLEALSKVVSCQKAVAHRIGSEIDVQNELIDDITDHVDRVDQRLIRQTKHVEVINKKSSSGCYWGMIVLLLIAIIVIACIPKS